MKKYLVIFLLTLATLGAQAQALGGPVAIVKLNSTYVITQQAFREREQIVASNVGRALTPQEQSSVLDSMIQDELFRQAAAQAGISATDDDVLRQLRQSNPQASDEQIKREMEQRYHMSWSAILVEIKKQLTAQKFLATQPGVRDIGKNLDVSESEITDFYNNHADKFVLPDMVRVSYIYFDTTVHPQGTLDEITQKAQDVLSKIQAGKITFEEAVRLYSQDARTARLNGDLGFVPKDIDSPNLQPYVQIYGKDFLRQLFDLHVGDVKLLNTSHGLAIVKITDHIQKHFLNLTDPIFPGQTVTVHDYIKQNLYREKAMKAEDSFIQKVGERLRNEADVKTYPQNM